MLPNIGQLAAAAGSRRREDERAAPLWHEADRRDAGEQGDDIAPGARCIDDDRCRVTRAARIGETGAIALPPQRSHLGVGDDAAAMPANAAQIALVQPGDVDVRCVGLEHGAEHAFATQRRDERARCVGIEEPAIRARRAQHRPLRIEQCALTRRGDEHRTARREDRAFGEALGRRVEKGAARPRQGANLRRAVARHEERRRATGRVIARLAFTLEQHDAHMRRQEVAEGRAGDATADDDGVAVDRGPAFSHHESDASFRRRRHRVEERDQRAGVDRGRQCAIPALGLDALDLDAAQLEHIAVLRQRRVLDLECLGLRHRCRRRERRRPRCGFPCHPNTGSSHP
jgi:hypothetical protein